MSNSGWLVRVNLKKNQTNFSYGIPEIVGFVFTRIQANQEVLKKENI